MPRNAGLPRTVRSKAMYGQKENPPGSEWSGERYVPELEGNIRLEHVHRYLIAGDLTKGKRVLDLACGEGYGSEILATAAANVVGVDIAAEVIANASSKYVLPNLVFLQGPCDAIPLPDQSVDVVVSFETVEHVDRPDEMINEIRRVLSRHGLLIISTPDRREYSDVLGNRNPYHIKEFDRKEFRDLLVTKFEHISLVGQRIRGGSIVGPLEGEEASTRFLTFPLNGPDETPIVGLAVPEYLIAFASDSPLPPIPAGLLDGGAFAWEREMAGLSSQVAAQCAEEIARRLGESVQLDGAEVEVIRREFVRQADLVSDQVKLATELQKVIDADRLRSHKLEALESTIRVARVRLNTYRSELERKAADIEKQDTALRRDLITEQSAKQQIQTELVKLQEELTGERTEKEFLKAQSLGLQEKLTGERTEKEILKEQSLELQVVNSQLRAEIRTYSHSRSWRYTAPMRSALGALLRARQGFRPDAGTGTDEVQHADPQSRKRMPQTVPMQARSSEKQDTSNYVPLKRTAPVETRIKLIAFYLPQFHPIPENDAWWGKGFTEWSNVVRANPQFPGHYQPHLPSDLGFYDLRLLENQRLQIELAKLHGVYGFCFHHYWFGGRKLLHRPLDQFLTNSDLDFPFCLCWANENWTRRWDGDDEDVLIAQQHSPADDIAFIRDIEGALRDQRYIRVDGRPLLIVYRPGLLPDPAATAQRWRAHCREVGLGEIFLVSTHSFDNRDPRNIGFDAAMEFAPNNMHVLPIMPDALGALLNPDFDGIVHDYRDLVEVSRLRGAEDYEMFRCVTPMWDNEPRRPSRGRIFAHSSPARYMEWLGDVSRWTDRHLADKPFVFVNAWNEWAEGAYLEPDQRYGYAYLNATADALASFPISSEQPSVVIVSHDAHLNGAQLIALRLAQILSTRLGYEVEIILCGQGSLAAEFGKIGRVHDFGTQSTHEHRMATIGDLYKAGTRLAICNTSVVGETVELLKGAGFSVVSLIHELPNLIREYGLEDSLNRITQHADRIIFPAEFVRERVSSAVGFPDDQSQVLPQGILSPNEFFGNRGAARREARARLGLLEGTRIVLGVGYADRRKGIDLFVEVGIRVMRTEKHLVFVWVGNCDKPTFTEIRSTIAKEGLSDRFLFPGPFSKCDHFFAGSDAYLMTSREDPFPNVVLEALDAEIPVIGFDGCGGFVELLKRGCGILVPFGDIDGMAKSLSRVLRSPDEAVKLATVGREILAREFSFINYARSLVEPTAPKVSVIVPSFNYARYLPQRLKSIVEQTYPPHEVLFLDDGSSDASVEVASQILHGSGLSYRIIVNAENQGTYRQWVRGMREATGDLIWIAEADDQCSPELLDRLVGQFDRPEVTLAYSQSRQIDDSGLDLAPDYLSYTAEISGNKWRESYVRPGLDEIRDSLAVKNTIPNVSAVLMRKVDFSTIEHKLLTLKHTGDWLVYLHVLEHGSIAFVPEALNSHRRHAGGVTIGGRRLDLMRETLLIQQYVDERYGIENSAKEQRAVSLQRTYEYLGLDANGPSSYKDHEDLRIVDWTQPLPAPEATK